MINNAFLFIFFASVSLIEDDKEIKMYHSKFKKLIKHKRNLNN